MIKVSEQVLIHVRVGRNKWALSLGDARELCDKLTLRLEQSRNGDRGIIVGLACRHFHTTLTEMSNFRRRHFHLADARAIAAWLQRAAGMSYPKIIPYKDNSSAFYAVRRAETLMSVDAAFYRSLRVLFEKAKRFGIRFSKEATKQLLQSQKAKDYVKTLRV